MALQGPLALAGSYCQTMNAQLCRSFPPGRVQDGPETGQGIGPGLPGDTDLAPPDCSGCVWLWRVAMEAGSLWSQILK